MVKFAVGDMLQGIYPFNADIYLVTTNSTLNNKKELVMGAGSAKQLANKVPETPRLFGKYIDANKKEYYGLIILEEYGVGAFQTKTNWRNKSTVELIEYSTNLLFSYSIARPSIVIYLTYPGVGLGGLSKDVVRPIIEKLPDTVTIWSLN